MNTLKVKPYYFKGDFVVISRTSYLPSSNFQNHPSMEVEILGLVAEPRSEYVPEYLVSDGLHQLIIPQYSITGKLKRAQATLF
ncbi:hypothetical protein EQG49_00360 [Periweissella cryptocerci]|uniref:Uncharacterized protein n=1 Tax=Periweissella cryptocerci TaxID=2506420 RepID=A0A4P6YQW9_9LACO|nr:hypothetical protein [Periweissella cryptocerci]QBO35007.1 hypothetical protein EQG49_00360 [Periweissella cryptocerci]